MRTFLRAFNADDGMNPVLGAGLVHLWFLTVHPFDDGNGRIARAIADMQLARSEGTSQRFYSMSSQIQQERKTYYDILERTQGETMDVTRWMEWFLDCLSRAIDGSQTLLTSVLAKARFWESIADTHLNERQRMILNRLLDGFESNLTNAKWTRLAKCSSDTALRDLQYLVDRGILRIGPAGGRSTNYVLEKRE
jgi:Fic family protein